MYKCFTSFSIFQILQQFAYQNCRISLGYSKIWHPCQILEYPRNILTSHSMKKSRRSGAAVFQLKCSCPSTKYLLYLLSSRKKKILCGGECEFPSKAWKFPKNLWRKVVRPHFSVEGEAEKTTRENSSDVIFSASLCFM